MQRHVLRLLLHLHHRVAPSSKLEALQRRWSPQASAPHTRLHPRVALPVLAPRAWRRRLRVPVPACPVGWGGVCARTHTVPWASPAEWRGSEGSCIPSLEKLESSWTTGEPSQPRPQRRQPWSCPCHMCLPPLCSEALLGAALRARAEAPDGGVARSFWRGGSAFLPEQTLCWSALAFLRDGGAG